MELWNQLCPSGRPTIGLAWQNLSCWSLRANFSNTFFSYLSCFLAHLTLPLYAIFDDLDLGWRSEGQHRAKPVGFIFLRTLQLMRMKFDALEQFELNILILFLNEIL